MIKAILSLFVDFFYLLLEKSGFGTDREEVVKITKSIFEGLLFSFVPFISFFLFSLISEMLSMAVSLIFLISLIIKIKEILFDYKDEKIFLIVADILKFLFLFTPVVVVEIILFEILFSPNSVYIFFAYLFSICWSTILWVLASDFYGSTEWITIKKFLPSLIRIWNIALEKTALTFFFLSIVILPLNFLDNVILRLLLLFSYLFLVYYFININFIRAKDFFDKLFKSSIISGVVISPIFLIFLKIQ